MSEFDIRPTGICCSSAVIEAERHDGGTVVVDAEPVDGATIAIVERVHGELLAFVGANPKASGPRFRLHGCAGAVSDG